MEYPLLDLIRPVVGRMVVDVAATVNARYGVRNPPPAAGEEHQDAATAAIHATVNPAPPQRPAAPSMQSPHQSMAYPPPDHLELLEDRQLQRLAGIGVDKIINPISSSDWSCR